MSTSGLDMLPKDLVGILAYDISYGDLINLCYTSKLFKSICNTPGFLRDKILHDIERQYQKCIVDDELFQGPGMTRFLRHMKYPIDSPIGLFISDILLKLSDRKTTKYLFADSLRSIARIFSSIGGTGDTPSPTTLDWKIAYHDKNYLTNFIKSNGIRGVNMMDLAIFDSLLNK